MTKRAIPTRRAGAVVAVALAAALPTVGCATKTHLRTEPVGMKVKIGEQDLGVVGPEGRDVDVPFGVGPVPVVLDDGTARESALPRSDLAWWIVALGIGGAVCCAPSLVVGAVCIANPAIFSAPVACLVGGPGICVTALAAPSWMTLPLVSAGACLGMTPLGFLFLAERPPESIVLKVPTAPIAGAPGAGDGDMAW